MWQLLYDSINSIEVIDLLDIPQVKALGIIEQIEEENQELKKSLINLIGTQYKIDESEIQRGYALVEEDKLLGVLFGNHILHLQMQPFYKELIQKKVVPLPSLDDIYNTTVERIINRIVKEKNSIISPKEFEILRTSALNINDIQYTGNTYCIHTTDFSELTLYHLCAAPYFKQIKNEFSKKWDTIVAMKDFKVTKLYYKKHLLIGFCLYRPEDGEQFFWSSQLQEVLESLINK